MGSDDLAPLLVPHHSADSGPTPALSSEEPARYGQGTILTWDAETFENTVRFRGTVLQNLPVMAGTDALTFQPGDKVGIMYWAPAGGSGVFWILPRIIVPGSGAAEQAIAALKSDLGRAVALAVFGEAIQVIQPSVGDGQFWCTRYNAWHTPSSYDGVVRYESLISVGASARMLVLLSAAIYTNPPPGSLGDLLLGFEIVEPGGSTVLGPDISRAVSIGRGAASVAETAEHPQAQMSRAVVVTEYTLKANTSYTIRALVNQSIDSTDPELAGIFNSSSIVVIPF